MALLESPRSYEIGSTIYGHISLNAASEKKKYPELIHSEESRVLSSLLEASLIS